MGGGGEIRTLAGDVLNLAEFIRKELTVGILKHGSN